MSILISAAAAVIPMFLFLILIWKFDRYGREPFKLVLVNYFWGAIGAIILALLGSWLISSKVASFVINKPELNHLETILVAPFVEEITKGIFLFIILSYKRFENLTEGIVYGGAIGLGFGMTENFLYFIAYSSSLSQWVSIVIIRSLFSGIIHCIATATFGAFLEFAKFKRLFHKIILTITGLLLAIFIHSVWNFSVGFQSKTGLEFVSIFLTLTIFIIILYLSVRNEKKIIYKELKEEAQNGLLPFRHLEILSSTRRNNFGWVDERIRKSYINATTTLAFRKIGLKNSGNSKKEFFQKEVDYYRNFIHGLLS